MTTAIETLCGPVLIGEDAASKGMTADEIRIVEALYGCSFCPGSTQKRFVRQMFHRDRGKPLTERQRAYLWAIGWSWRRQLPGVLVDLAHRYSAGVGIRGRQVLESRA
ncbi:MAG: hypothetical protein JNN08_03070 [Bryobacterales bacterium]|nr:hypothetical protein [Bryobacterales bacterium]